MKILFLGTRDNANWSHNLVDAINTTQTEHRADIAVLMPTDYFRQRVVKITELAPRHVPMAAREIDWLFITDDANPSDAFLMLDRLECKSRPKLAIRHMGSFYRQRTAEARETDEFLEIDAIFYHPEFYGQIPTPAPHEFPYIHITDANPHEYGNRRPAPTAPLRAFHCPSNVITNGSKQIERAMYPDFASQVDFMFDLPHQELRRERLSYNYCLDKWNPAMQTVGASAIESAGVGTVPILNFFAEPTLASFEALNVPPPPFLHTQTPYGAREFLSASHDWWLEKSRACKTWAQTYCSPVARVNHFIESLKSCE